MQTRQFTNLRRRAGHPPAAHPVHVGDVVVVRGEGQPVREGLVVAVPHPDGSPPCLVRWTDEGHPALVYPGSDSSLPDA